MIYFHSKDYYLSLLLTVLVVLPGCGTILTTTVVPHDTNVSGESGQTIPWVYSGTFLDYHCFWHPLIKETDNVELFCLIDIPLSVVADTIILPVTIPLQVSNKKADESYQQSTMQGTGGDDISATGQNGIAGTLPQESGADRSVDKSDQKHTSQQIISAGIVT